MHIRRVLRALGILAVSVMVVAANPRLNLAHAADFTFDVGDTTIPPGTGNKLIQNYFPAASSLGLGTTLEAQLQPAVNTLASALKTDVETRLNQLNFAPFVSRSATAGAAAARATSVDHASFIKLFSLTAAGSGAITGFDGFKALGKASMIDNNIENGQAPNYGVAPGVSAMLGFNFGALNLRHFGYFNPNRLQLYVSAMHFNLTYNGDEVRATSSNFGAHVKYQLFEPASLVGNTMVRWGGLNVATGLTWASTDLAFHTSLPSGNQVQTTQVQIGTTSQTIALNGMWTGDADINARMRAYTVPIEVSSFLQLAYLFTLFGGLAMDLNFGHMQMDATARAPLTISASAQGSNTSVAVLTPKPTLAYLLKQSPVHIDGRVFLGLQINAGVIAVYGQGMVDTSQTVMASVGLRGFY